MVTSVTSFAAGLCLLAIGGCSLAGKPGADNHVDMSRDALKGFPVFDYQPGNRAGTQASSAALDSTPTLRSFCGESAERGLTIRVTGTYKFDKASLRNIPGYEQKSDAELEQKMKEKNADGIEIGMERPILLCLPSKTTAPVQGAIGDDGRYFPVAPDSTVTKEADGTYRIEAILRRDIPFKEIPERIRSITGFEDHIKPDGIYQKIEKHSFRLADSPAPAAATGRSILTIEGSLGLEFILQPDSISAQTDVAYSFVSGEKMADPPQPAALARDAVAGESSAPASGAKSKIEKGTSVERKILIDGSTDQPKRARKAPIDTWTTTLADSRRFNKPADISWKELQDHCAGTLARFPVRAKLRPQISAEIQKQLEERIRANAEGNPIKRGKCEAFQKLQATYQKNYFIFAGVCLDDYTSKLKGGICTTGETGGPERCYETRFVGAKDWQPIVQASLRRDRSNGGPEWNTYAGSFGAQRFQSVDDTAKNCLLTDAERTAFAKGVPHMVLLEGTLAIGRRSNAAAFKGKMTTLCVGENLPWCLTWTGEVLGTDRGSAD
jgi:hypothetical protein